MGWNDHLDPYEDESFEDEYFDGDELDEDLLYSLHEDNFELYDEQDDEELFEKDND
jgi:hypothetical protein